MQQDAQVGAADSAACLSAINNKPIDKDKFSNYNIHRISTYKEFLRMEVSMKINKELMKGSTSILVLSLLYKEDMYGYQITHELKKLSESVFELKEGTLYPMLHGLENEKAIESYWFDADNGKRRKYYRITKTGKKLLQDKKSEWQTYTKAVNSVIGGVCFE